MRELLLGLSLIQAWICHENALKNYKILAEAVHLRRLILASPKRARNIYCQARPDPITVDWHRDGRWYSICHADSPYPHASRRYWRLIVSIKYEILGIIRRDLYLEFKLFR
jgi:hypothetical protein